ncbi:unnamed protein product [Phaeothamnion confervicola]
MWAPNVEPMTVDEDAGVKEYDESKELREKLDSLVATLTVSGDTDAAVAGFREQVLNYKHKGPLTDGIQKVKEESIYKLAKAYADARRFSDVMNLVRSAEAFFTTIPKARTAKVVRTVIDIVSKVPNSLGLQVELCEQVVAWCRAEKRTFLRQRIQSRLAGLMFEQGKYQEAVALVNRLLRELKRLDDKQLLVETHLVEARIHNALRNSPKSKAALTAARTAGNAIYIAPLMQAELDEMSGTLHCEEGDHKTSFSYFLEAYEAFDSQGDGRALRCLKYMMLCKVLQHSAAEVSALMSGKWGIKHSGEDLEAMAAVAKAAKNRSLGEYDAAVAARRALLDKDLLIKHHLGALYEQLLEANLAKIIEPFSCVEIARVAELIALPVPAVERKLGQMILDKKLRGILDQGRGQLVLYDEAPGDKVYEDGLAVIANMGKVVDSLFHRVQLNLAH